MSKEGLAAISPIDGRYKGKTAQLSEYFSEQALIKYRLLVEVEYFIALSKIPLKGVGELSETQITALRDIYTTFSVDDAGQIKEIEKTTNHDVKAVEYFLKEKLVGIGLEDASEFIHFGLTSQDINNTAVPLSIKHALEEVYIPIVSKLLETLKVLAEDWKDVPMLARTHGQAASPTRLGKELMVFVERISWQLDLLLELPHSAKFGGATGNFNAHHVAFPKIDWVDFSNTFVNEQLGLSRLQLTTQIEHYDNMSAIFDNLRRINTILIDLSRDVWTYISMDYFKQVIKKGEVGSSAMPHKVNPIDFENAEGNLGMANAILNHLAGKLPISRLQRDLTDSTVSRNIGVPFGHILIAIQSMQKGLGKLLLNKAKIDLDLENNWAVVAEAIQTILRREGVSKPYEKLKDFSRTNSVLNQVSVHAFIDSLEVQDAIKSELKEITPFNYTGVSFT